MIYSIGEEKRTITKPITCDGDNVLIEGLAPNMSTLICDDCNGLELTIPDGAQATIRNLTILTNGKGYFNGIRLYHTDGSHYRGTGLIIENVCLSGVNPTVNYWHTPLYVHNGWWMTVHNLTVYGASQNKFASRGIVIDGNTVGGTFDKTNVFWCGDAFEVMGSCEGISLEICHFVDVRTGVYWHTSPLREPSLSITSSHVHSYLFCVYTNRLMQLG